MPGIGIISNPYARINKFDPNHNHMMWYILGNQGQFEVTLSKPELSRVCKEFKERKIDLIGIVGGDGTISLTLSAIAEEFGNECLPKIAILRGGTINVLATNLGLQGNPKEILADLLESLHSGQKLNTVTVPTLNVNGRLGFLFANGMASKFLEKFYEKKSNAVGAALFLSKIMSDGIVAGKLNGLFTELSNVEKWNLNIDSDKNTFSTNSSMTFVSTLPKLPFGYHFFKNAFPSLKQAEIISIESSGYSLIGESIKILMGASHYLNSVRKATLKNTCILSGPKKSVFTVDGDLFEAENEIEINIGPSFNFVTPYKIPKTLK